MHFPPNPRSRNVGFGVGPRAARTASRNILIPDFPTRKKKKVLAKTAVTGVHTMARRAAPSRKRARVDRTGYVRNPETGGLIRVGSAMFQRLVGGADPLYDYDPVGNRLYFRVPDEFIIVTAIRDPSTGDIEPRASPVILTPELVRIVRSVVRGRANIDELRRAPDLLESQPFLAESLAQFTWGPYVWSADDIENNAGPLVVAGPSGQTALGSQDALIELLRGRLTANAPLGLPFLNADTNPGEDERCVHRFMDDPVVQPTDTSVKGLIEACRQVGDYFDLRFFDVLGGTIAHHVPDNVAGRPIKVRRAILYQGHAYPLAPSAAGHRSETYPMLVRGPVHRYVFPDDVITRLRETHRAYFRIGSRFLVGGGPETDGVDGVWEPEAAIWEDWMGEFLRKVPLGRGMDPSVQAGLKRSALSLYYADPGLVTETAFGPGLTTEEMTRRFASVDMTRCYWRVLCELCAFRELPNPTLFARWREYSSSRTAYHLDLPVCYFRLRPEVMSRLTRYGLRTNVVSGHVVAVLLEWSILARPLSPTEVTHFVQFEREDARAQEAVFAEIKTWDLDRRKAYAIVNGVMGKVEHVSITEFELNRVWTGERAYYLERYGAEMTSGPGPDMMTRTVRRPWGVHRLHVHAAVVNRANAAVLDKMFRLRGTLGRHVMPVRIKVDALTYRRSDLRTPWTAANGSEVERLADAAVTPDWHVEVSRPEARTRFFQTQELPAFCVETHAVPTFGRNRTYWGPPGVGKTWAAMHRHEYDVAACYSNKGARRIGGVTLNAAFRVWDLRCGHVNVEHLRGKTVFVDEAQAAGRAFWGLFLHAYLSVGTSFIFSMDPNQLSPVGEPAVEIVPFHGRVTRLTVDRRNDAALINARDHVLTGTFSAVRDAMPGSFVTRFEDGGLTLTNVAFTNATCAVVNRLVAGCLGVDFGTAGARVIVRATRKTLGLLKSEVLTRTDATTFARVPDGAHVVIPVPVEEQRQLLALAYCVTIHKQIGETLEDAFTIWDVDHPAFDRRLMYTGLTRARTLSQVTFRPRPDPTEVAEYLDFITRPSVAGP